ncbi:MAG TPA: hypothetical protein P5328_02550 [Candidatus Paceibacterota bacterium]|nr:hypothetical protein [Candidatus Paceibacterota bacterium]HRZ34324.1 hypothetical protein [Candidatus Paceibacterota bacterium]
MRKIIFDLRQYIYDQLVDMFLSQLNRWATREAHGWCDDCELHRHPEWLVEHYLKHGGAEYWAKRREQYFREVEVPDPATPPRELAQPEFHI